MGDSLADPKQPNQNRKTPFMFQEIFEIAFPLFLIMDPVGNSPMCLSVLKNYSPRRQRRIILRELTFALAIIILFNFMGEQLLNFLNIQLSTMKVAGGIILFIISINMVFPKEKKAEAAEEEPFLVPIAMPLIAGPSLLTAVMLYSSKQGQGMIVLSSIILAWLVSLTILMSAPSLKRILGEKGIKATERLMGMLLIFMSVQMFEDGIKLFISEIR